MGKKEPPPEEGAPLWMCTYGDLMSLLLCFFIMLFALSIIAEPRFQAVADALSQDFGYAGSSTTRAPKTRTTTTPADSAAKSKRISPLVGGQPMPGPVGESSEVHTILLDGETIGVIRFELGSDELTEQAQLDLRAMLPRLRGADHKIMIKGHIVPAMEGGENQQNVDLAFLRALSVVDHFVGVWGLKQDAFEIVDDSTTAPKLNLLPAGTDPQLAGASVEIIILNQTIRELR